MGDLEGLPFELIEELKAKNLYAFVSPTESTCNKIVLVIYENQKFRPVIGNWGSNVGVHIFPRVDRPQFSNEIGNKGLR